MNVETIIAGFAIGLSIVEWNGECNAVSKAGQKCPECILSDKGE